MGICGLSRGKQSNIDSICNVIFFLVLFFEQVEDLVGSQAETKVRSDNT